MQQEPLKELDLEAIEAALVLMPRLGRFPALFDDMRALVAEVRRLRAITDEQAAELVRLRHLERLVTKVRVETDLVEIEGVPV